MLTVTYYCCLLLYFAFSAFIRYYLALLFAVTTEIIVVL